MKSWTEAFLQAANHVLLRGLGVGQHQIAADAVVEQMGLLGNKLSIRRRSSVFTWRSPGRNGHLPLLGLPEPQEQLQKGGFSAAAAAGNADDAMLRNLHGHPVQHRFPAIGKGDVLSGSAGEADGLLPGHVRHAGFFFQNVQHPVARCEGILQGCPQIGQRHGGTEGTHQRHGGDEGPGKRNAALHIKKGAEAQHTKVKKQNGKARDGLILPGDFLHGRFVGSQAVGPAVQFGQAVLTPAILLDFRQTTEAVQQEGTQCAGFVPEPEAQAPAAPGCNDGNDQPNDSVSRQRQQAQSPMIMTNEQAQDQGKQRRNGRRGRLWA